MVLSYKDKVFNYCFRVCNDYHLAEEVTQEVFIKIFKNISAYDWRKSSLSTWIYTLTHNTCINSLRSFKREIPCEEINAVTQADTAEEEYLRKEMLVKLEQAIMLLAPEDRSLVVMKDYLGFSLREISGIFNLPAGTVKSRLHGIRNKIRTLMGDFDDQ